MPTLPGGAELLIILFIVLLLFGAKKLPGLAGSIGTSMKEFRRAAGDASSAEGDEPVDHALAGGEEASGEHASET